MRSTTPRSVCRPARGLQGRRSHAADRGVVPGGSCHRHRQRGACWLALQLRKALQLVQVEQAFRDLKGDLTIRPIFHQNQSRIESHLFVSFLAYCLHVTLGRWLQDLAPGLTGRRPGLLPYQAGRGLPCNAHFGHSRLVLTPPRGVRPSNPRSRANRYRALFGPPTRRTARYCRTSPNADS